MIDLRQALEDGELIAIRGDTLQQLVNFGIVPVPVLIILAAYSTSEGFTIANSADLSRYWGKSGSAIAQALMRLQRDGLVSYESVMVEHVKTYRVKPTLNGLTAERALKKYGVEGCEMIQAVR